ncbi:MAG TPA: alkaline phosphatase family protein [Allosphingosinicella sp.]|uniref:alkaline phosphatase family protein n=1 Tax=Allosphingosinicella sp. TaxID=2823234 RepID=UPI002ED80ED4
MRPAFLLPLAAAAAFLDAPGHSEPIIVVTLHGADLREMETLRARSILPADGPLAETIAKGRRALVVPIDPALTSTARVTMLTGTYPSKHGIVGNSFLKDDRPGSGFGTPFAAETLWEAGRRQGRRIVRIGTLFPHGSGEPQAGDYVVASGRWLGASQVLELAPRSPADAAPQSQKIEFAARIAPEGDEAIQVAGRTGEAPIRLRAVAVDTRKDGRRVFDGIVLDDDDDRANGWKALLRPGEWAPVEFTAGASRAGRWLKLLAVNADSGQARLYVGAAHEGRGYPADFLAAVEQKAGFFPGSPDYDRLRDGSIDERTWIEQMERENRYFADAAVAASGIGRFDAMILEQPAIDNAVHQFLRVDPRQTAFDDAARRTRFQSYIAHAYRLVDANLKRVIEAQPRQPKVALVSDYSLLPAHRRYDLNAILRGAGFSVEGDAPVVRVRVSSTSAHLYFDKSKTADAAASIAKAAALLRSFRDVGGEPVFEDVLTPEQQVSQNIFFPGASGDLWVRARPGYTLSARQDRLDVLSDEPLLRGEHGYRASGRAGMGMVLLRGGNARSTNAGYVCAVDVTALLSDFIGMDPPRDWKAPRSSAETLTVQEADDCARRGL